MTDLRFLRQQDAVNMNRLSRLRVTIIGAGSVGSVTAFWLLKMGILDISIYDADIVQDHNWSNQMYRLTDVNRPKVQALSELALEFGMQSPQVYAEQYINQPLTELVISTVDSMASRKAIWKAVRTQPQVQLYLDARMGLETLVVHAVHPLIREDRVRYSQTLHTDADSLQEPCTARTICYTPLMASAVLCNMVKRFANGEDVPGQVVVDLVTYTTLKS